MKRILITGANRGLGLEFTRRYLDRGEHVFAGCRSPETARHLGGMQAAYPIGGADTILQKTPYTFDVSVWELFWWAMEGASVHLLEPGGRRTRGPSWPRSRRAG